MKFIWEEDDVVHGMFYHRGYVADEFSKEKTKDERDSDIKYALSTLMKLGTLTISSDDGSCEQFMGKGESRVYYGMAMTDGIMFPVGTKKEVAAYLTKRSYKRTTATELQAMVGSDAGCCRLIL